LISSYKEYRLTDSILVLRSKSRHERAIPEEGRKKSKGRQIMSREEERKATIFTNGFVEYSLRRKKMGGLRKEKEVYAKKKHISA